MTNPFAPQQPAQENPGGQFGTPAQQIPPYHIVHPLQQPVTAPFAQPAKGSGDGITGEDWRSWIGRLILFVPHEYREGIPTRNGPANAVVADVHVIDCADSPLFRERALVFPPALVTALKVEAQSGGGQRILGRLATYTTQAGRDTVELVDHDPADVKTAIDYLQWREQQTMRQPGGGEEPAF